MSATSVQTPSGAGQPQPNVSHSDVNGQKPNASQPAANDGDPDALPPSTDGVEYPEQKHAGAVGYGPNYRKGPDTGDKLIGLTQEVKGKIMHKPDLVQHGKEMRTGELRRKELEGDNEMDPFATAGGDDKDKPKDQKQGGKDVPKANTTSTGAQPGLADTTHPSENGAKEQAATTAPEGTSDAEVQRKGEQADKQIDE